MGKITMAIKMDEKIADKFRSFCKHRGIKYSFFVEDAIKEKLEEEEIKDDILDLKTLHKEDKFAVPFEEYLRNRNV